MTHHLRIFISHAWDRTDLYFDLVSLLDSIEGLTWKNLSIPEDEAIELRRGDQEVVQRKELLGQRYDALLNRKTRLEQELAELLRFKIQSINERARIQEAMSADRLIERARDDLISDIPQQAHLVRL